MGIEKSECVTDWRTKKEKKQKNKKILPNFCCFGQASHNRRQALKSTLQPGEHSEPVFAYPFSPSAVCVLLGTQARLPSACANCISRYVPPLQARSPRLEDR